MKVRNEKVRGDARLPSLSVRSCVDVDPSAGFLFYDSFMKSKLLLKDWSICMFAPISKPNGSGVYGMKMKKKIVIKEKKLFFFKIK